MCAFKDLVQTTMQVEERKLKCESCGDTEQIFQCVDKFEELPETLILMVKRVNSEGRKDFRTVKTSNRLLMNRYCSSSYDINFFYELRSIVFHTGRGSNQGHYVAQVFNEMGNNKYTTLLNDELIESSLESTVPFPGDAYILLYDKVEVHSLTFFIILLETCSRSNVFKYFFQKYLSSKNITEHVKRYHIVQGVLNNDFSDIPKIIGEQCNTDYFEDFLEIFLHNVYGPYEHCKARDIYTQPCIGLYCSNHTDIMVCNQIMVFQLITLLLLLLERL